MRRSRATQPGRDSSLPLEELQDVLALFLGGESNRARAFVVLQLGIGTVREQIANQLGVSLPHRFVQWRPPLLLPPVDRRARVDAQLHRPERASRGGPV